MAVHVHDLLHLVVEREASDLHITAGEKPVIRVDGEIERIGDEVLTPDQAKRLIYSVMTEKQKARFEQDLEVDFSIGLKGLSRFRVNVYMQARGIGMAMRRIPDRILTIDELGLPTVFHDIARFRKGLVLVTGPTGSGKSTTLAAVIDEINEQRAEHILTIEDPVEFVHQPKRCIVNQREVGTHTHSFANALRAALREDPDIILVGELRDLETISLALTAAETGHLVFGTLHTMSAPDTIDRIIDAYPAAQQAQVRAMLSTSLQAVVSQMLLKAAQGGRVVAMEIMLVNSAIRNLIRQNKLHQIPSVIQSSRGQGMQTIEDSVRELVYKGKVSRQVAIEALNDPDLFKNEERPGGGGGVAGARYGSSQRRR